MTVINLNGEGAKVNFNLKTVSKHDEKYNFLVYHNARNTVSHIVNNGVNILDGVLEFNVSGFVSNGIVGCDINQSGRIINMTDNVCIIKLIYLLMKMMWWLIIVHLLGLFHLMKYFI